jgi:hypothetical protein
MHASCFGISFDEISLTFVQHIHYMTSANDNSTLKHIPKKHMEILKSPKHMPLPLQFLSIHLVGFHKANPFIIT